MAKKIIGVTGSLASGKTTIANMFADKGAVKIDADEIAHEILKENGLPRDRAIDIFGNDILLEGDIDRRKLAEKVFFDRKKLDDLCRVLHPAVIRRIKDLVARHEEEIVVIDAPLLLEAGLGEYVDVVVVVTADRDTQIKRATDRGISEDEARSIIKSQMPLAEKTRSADYIIDSSGSVEKMKEGVEKIWKKI